MRITLLHSLGLMIGPAIVGIFFGMIVGAESQERVDRQAYTAETQRLANVLHERCAPPIGCIIPTGGKSR